MLKTQIPYALNYCGEYMLEKFIRDALVLWTTIDPIGTLAIFSALTINLTRKERFQTALKATIYATLVLVASIVIGQILLSAMGISLISLQVAGGIILFIFAMQMIFGSGGSNTAKEEHGHDLAVFPIAIPSIATPGAIMAVILLTDNHIYPIEIQIGTTLILLAILTINFLFMLFASSILNIIGRNGANILVRVMGMILAALSIELILQALDIFKFLG